MKLESARELKESLMASLVPALIERVHRVRAYGLAAGPTDRKTNPRAFALGLAPAKRGFRLAIRIQHRALEESPMIEQMKRRAKGEVDVRYIGRVHIRSAWHQSRQRPLLPGCSIGHYKITAGTLGAFVRPKEGGNQAILSNNHVLANEDRAKPGDAILQPGQYDGGKNPQDAVAELTRFVRLQGKKANLVDAAIAMVKDGIGIYAATLKGIGKLKGVGTAAIDKIAVRKVGRTTGATKGQITAFEVDRVMVEYDAGTLRFDNQLEIEGENTLFSSGGDSGSLIVDSDNLAVGLLFAGSDQGGADGRGVTYANPIQVVLDKLAVNLET